MLSFHRLWIWCRRYRHRCGYGVQSPSDFFLVTSVIYEKTPYYAYNTLKRRGFPSYLPHYRGKVNRMLFRLVNYMRPATLMEVGIGNGSSIGYMRAACQTMKSVALRGKDWEKTLQQMEKFFSTIQTLDCLHIAHTPFYEEVFEQALSHVGQHSCFIIGGIYESKEKKEWWKKVVASKKTGITFDLYDVGLVFFDKARYKQHYIVNLF